MIHAEIKATPMNQKLRSENTYEYVYKYVCAIVNIMIAYLYMLTMQLLRTMTLLQLDFAI